MAPVFLCFLIFFSLLSSSSSSSSSSSPTPTIKLSLYPTHTPNPTSNQWELISHIAKSSLERAYHLKSPKKKPQSPVFHNIEKPPLYPRSYGGYSVSLSFGTPPQPIPLVFDTGSSLLWVPCTSNYTCSSCNFSGVDPTNIPTFKPKLSSTTRIVGCRNPKCGLLFGSDVKARCPGCGPKNCSQSCPSYILQYGLGSTIGLTVTDNLDFSTEAVPGFFFGCSLLSQSQPEGIAGFGRAPTSVPSQLKLEKFSYCLLSHKFDDVPKSSDLILTGKLAGKVSDEVSGVKYTRFQKNPAKSPYNEYYYVSLAKITVGKKKVKFPHKLLRPGPNGNGGVIVDSGSTLTFMDRALFGPLVAEFTAQMSHYKRAHDAEAGSGFGLCYDISKERNVSIPELVFHFNGGAKMELSLSNYFSLVGPSGGLCLTIVSDSGPGSPSVAVGPAMILGNYQQQNFFIEYDLEGQRFGFKKQICG